MPRRIGELKIEKPAGLLAELALRIERDHVAVAAEVRELGELRAEPETTDAARVAHAGGQIDRVGFIVAEARVQRLHEIAVLVAADEVEHEALLVEREVREQPPLVG